MKKALPGHAALARPEIDVVSQPGTPAFPDYETGKKALAAFDAAFVALAESLGHEERAATADVHGNNQTVSTMFASGIAHAAHHRGQVSQVLDEMGIENDFFMAIKGC